MASSFVGDVWVGTSLGVLKGQGAAMKHIIFVELYLGLSVSRKETFSFLPAGFPLERCDRTREVMCMSWDYKSKERVRE